MQFIFILYFIKQSIIILFYQYYLLEIFQDNYFCTQCIHRSEQSLFHDVIPKIYYLEKNHFLLHSFFLLNAV